MTREEQIIKASQLYAKHQQKPFMDGAIWADKHPINYDGKAMLHVLNKGHEQGWKDAFEKASIFVYHLATAFPDTSYIDVDKITDGFKKYMEENK